MTRIKCIAESLPNRPRLLWQAIVLFFKPHTRWIQEGARTALSACWSAPFSETRGQGCPRSFRALLESAVGSRRREEAELDLCRNPPPHVGGYVVIEFRRLTAAATLCRVPPPHVGGYVCFL